MAGIQLSRFLILSVVVSVTNSLPGASHALFASLGSCAHGIALDGTSCLLSGPGKSLSFGLLLSMVVGVLARPVLALFILNRSLGASLVT